LYCSRRSYFRQETQTAINQIVCGCEQLLKLRDAAASDLIFIRYEDIVLGDPGEYRRVSNFLGFDLPAPDTTADASSNFATHATSQSPQSSIARWRQQMTADEVEAFRQSCTQFFDAFGYDRDNGELAPATSIAALRPRPAVPVGTDRPANVAANVRSGSSDIGLVEAARPPERFRFVRQITE
jgi:hypothetical protein